MAIVDLITKGEKKEMWKFKKPPAPSTEEAKEPKADKVPVTKLKG